MTNPIPHTKAGLLGAVFMAAALLGLAGCNKRENPPTTTTDTTTSGSSTTTTTPPPMPAPASDAMPAVPPASAASQ